MWNVKITLRNNEIKKKVSEPITVSFKRRKTLTILQLLREKVNQEQNNQYKYPIKHMEHALDILLGYLLTSARMISPRQTPLVAENSKENK